MLTIASMHDSTIHMTRRINADPTSAALLLASDAGDLLGGDRPIDAVIRAAPPVRTPTAFVIRLSFVARDVPPNEGTLTLTYASTDDGGAATHADLRFTIPPGQSAEKPVVGVLTGLAGRFLDNLAAAAQQRSFAA
jgi:hypothetical protein